MKYFFKGNSAIAISNIFQTLLVTYLALLLIEQLWTGVVSNYMNLNYMLVVVLILGVLDMFSERSYKEQKETTKKDYFFVIFLAIVGFIIIKVKTPQLGWLSWLISVIAGVLIYLLSILVLEDQDEVE